MEPEATATKRDIKMMIATDTMQESGDLGTPMLSSKGKRTSVEYPQFQRPAMVQAESTFAQSKT